MDIPVHLDSSVGMEATIARKIALTLLRNPGPKYRLHLKSLPPGVSNVRISPQEVDYLIENVASDDSEE